MSKGSNRRPAAVPRATVDANYERTFRHTNVTLNEMGRKVMGELVAQSMREWAPGHTSYEYDTIAGQPTRLVAINGRTPSDRTDAQG